MTRMKRVCCLYRVSTLGQVEKDDIPMQKQACREFADAQGWEIVKEYSEKGVSGFKVATKDRDAIQEIKKDALAGRFDILLVFMFDRLGRRDDETPFVVEWFVKNGIEVWSTQEGQQRFDNHVDKLMNYIRFWQASGESEKTSIRTKTRLGQIVQEGRFRGGFCAYGFRLEKQGRLNKKNYEVNEVVVDEYESSVVRTIFQKYAYEGMGTHRIAMYLTEQGIKSRSGDSWHPATILNMLKNVAYHGILRSGESASEVFPHLKIVDQETFDRAQKLIAQRSKKKDVERTLPMCTKGRSLLSGNIYCGHCGGRLTPTTSGRKVTLADGTVKGKKRQTYVCYNKTRKRQCCDGPTSYTSHIIDGIVTEAIHKLFDKLKDSPQDTIFNTYYNHKLNDCKASLAYAKKVYEQDSKELATLEAEVVKALSGTSTFPQELLNKLIAQKTESVKTAKSEIENLQTELDFSKKLLSEAKEKYNTLLSWAEMFDNSSPEAKKMIASYLINKVSVKKDYDITIEFNTDVEQFNLTM